MSFLAPLRQVSSITETVLKGRAIPVKAVWMSRSFSTQPSGCSKKCSRFNPNRPCCRHDDVDDEINQICHPAYQWHPLNIHHQKNVESPSSSKPEKPLDIDGSSFDSHDD